MGNIVVISAPQGTGKTSKAGALAEALGCSMICDNWDGKTDHGISALYLTNLTEFSAPVGATVFKAHNAVVMNFCKKCAHFYTPRLMKDGVYLCGYGLPRHVVTGVPVAEKKVSCYEARAIVGNCGPSGRLFAESLSADHFNGVFNPADLSVDRNGLNEGTKQGGVVGGKSCAEFAIDLGNCSAQVASDHPGTQDSGLVDY